MTQQNRDIERLEIRGITFPIIRTVVGCTIAMCLSAIGSAVYIRSTFQNHEDRIITIEKWKDRIDDKAYSVHK